MGRSGTSGKVRAQRDGSPAEEEADPSGRETIVQPDWETMIRSWAEREQMALDEGYSRSVTIH
jgi:hypothetical protein